MGQEVPLDPSIIGLGVVFIKYGGYFPYGRRVTFLNYGEGNWVPTRPHA